MRQRTYPGSDITLEQELLPGSNYRQYIASYQSDGLKIYGLLTIPIGEKPATGWPAIIFNHGFIPPNIYRTTERYVAYVAALARSGYVVFKPDYRGHGSSEGVATGGYGSPDYTVDVLNALASVKRLPDVDPNRIGMWGHSMGGMVTLRAMVTSKDIKAGVIWSGVVASYADLLTKWHRPGPNQPTPTPNLELAPPEARRWRNELIQQYGTPDQNPDFWNSISPISYVSDISGPLQLHHSATDPEVPIEFSQSLDQAMQAASQTVEFYTYQGDNHNLSNSFGLAMQRTIAFFDKYVKGVK
jgi:dipeptidyl aminopeptidase/acylaminoacyl peptidase